MSPFEINFHSKPEVVWLGDHEVPLFVIDDFYVDPQKVRAFAFERSFPDSQAYYPGRHQPLDPGMPGIAPFRVFVSKVLSHATKRNISPESINTDFSVLTTAENALVENQGQPHIDGTPMLGVIYLNVQDYGGTVFFRNRDTGSMTVVSPAEKAHYESVTKSQSEKRPDTYITDSQGAWEKVTAIEGRLNRLVIWPGNVWHSVEVKVPPEQGSLNEKRLTQRVIINRMA
ncbi:hypothetical protein FWJ25_02970 [Marinobacter salinexigens]|uniref:Prolyl 4-hydroxylase alpha subunit Fe(2+) 2OG dioxygenase domain-containing protein n=1 Tax=Marinobacter salinexigens TaxID=2919747 RepID=A0A5B0VMZ7_9GAMM|nr:DUF6445 family protein [Marinobacter salinexigens]KAA1176110.1 hypothetical protein FWJ25_02970 [Marinobacter salinexigens]